MKKKMWRAGFLGRLAAAAAAGVLLMTGAAVTSAQASGSCTPSERQALWISTTASVRLVRTAGCTYYARLVTDEQQWGTWHVRVERREGGTITAWRQKDVDGPYGNYNTAAVDGWWAGAASQDQHHACWTIGSSAWSCTDWFDI
jgi:hypothetical protein